MLNWHFLVRGLLEIVETHTIAVYFQLLYVNHFIFIIIIFCEDPYGTVRKILYFYAHYFLLITNIVNC